MALQNMKRNVTSKSLFSTLNSLHVVQSSMLLRFTSHTSRELSTRIKISGIFRRILEPEGSLEAI